LGKTIRNYSNDGMKRIKKITPRSKNKKNIGDNLGDNCEINNLDYQYTLDADCELYNNE